MTGITFATDPNTVAVSDAQNAFDNLRAASPDFNQDILYIASKTRVLVIIADDPSNGSSSTTAVSPLDTAYYGTYDYVIRIPLQGFDGDTYNHVSSDKWTLERLYAHEIAHVLQELDPNSPTLLEDREEQAVAYSNNIMTEAHPEDDSQTSYYNTPGDSSSGLNMNSGSGDSPHILDPSSPTGSLLPGAPLPEQFNDIQPAFGNAVSAASPLVIDLSTAHSGITLTTWSASSSETYFDLNDNGFAVQTAWVSGDTGLLARDINANGIIDSSAELFGSPTVDGFAKLATLDSNHDLRIDNNDADWNALVVWTDTNGDAVTQDGELHSLASLGIESIDLAGVASSTSTISGNPISHTSTVRFTGGATAAIDDAWFVHDNTNSYFAGDYTLDMEAIFLPHLRGYGTLPSLTIAMSQDNDLKDMVSNLAANFSLADLAGVKADVTELLYKWAGVDGVYPVSRGPYVDAQHLEFLEHFLGASFLQWESNPNPYPQAAAYIEQAYQKAFDMVTADLLAQVDAAELFSNPITYNPGTGSISGDFALSQTAVTNLGAFAPTNSLDNQEFWNSIAHLLDATKGLSNLTGSETSWLDSAVQTSNASLHWSDVLNGYNASLTGVAGSSISGTSGADTLSGGIYDDTIHGYAGADTIHGSYGNDVIYGEDDADVLYGDDGNDTLHGGPGNDILYGGDGNDLLYGEYGNDTYYGGAGGNFITAQSGNDTFVYGGGADVINDYGGTDQILLPSGIDLADLSFARVSTAYSTTNFNDLLITINGEGSIQIANQFTSYGIGGNSIETLVFSDASSLNLTTLANPVVYLSGGNDTFSTSFTGDFTVYGGDGNDYISNYQSGAHTFDGGNGNDTLRGGSGNDTYIASTGFDIIQENAGTDTIVVPAGYTIDDVSFYRIPGTYGPSNDLGISISGLGEIDVQGQFASTTVEYLHFNEDNTTLALTDLSIATIGTAGNDNLYPPSAHAGANDFMDGREGDDYLAGGAGDDKYVFSAGHDRVYDTGGDDTILIRDSYTPSDITVAWNYSTNNYSDNRGIILTDSDGNTQIVQDQSYYSYNSVEHIKFADGTTWDLSSMELELRGTEGNDSLDGKDIGDASSADTIYGLGGNDTINGHNGDDLIYGGDGDDYLLGNAGNDTLYGGAGADIIYAASNDGNDTEYGEDGNDTLKGADHSTLYGGDGDDELWNIATSSYAATTEVTMFGGNGADHLCANYGKNIMDGGAGADILQGSGNGEDTFVFDAATAFDAVDTIQYFQKTGTNADHIDISDVLNGHYDPLTDAITDFVQITTNGSNSELYVDTTGSGTFGTAQHIATIQGVTGMTDEDALVTAGTLIAA